MSGNFKKIGLWVGIVLVALLLVMAVLWLFNGSSGGNAPWSAFFGSPGSTESPFGTSPTENPPLTEGPGNSGTTTPQKIFLVAEGPIIAAIILESIMPTTTSARYVTATDGHVLEVALGVPGAFPHVVSQTTIPGVQRALFTDRGSGVLMQYLEGSTIKTVHLSFVMGSSSDISSALQQTLIQFLPNNLEDIAASPDGSKLAYLSHAAKGLDGYISKSDGTGAKKLFSLPLTEVTLSWTSPDTLLAYSKVGVGVPGIVFSVDAKSGAVSPILYGSGISAIANASLAHILYQTADQSLATFIDTTKDGSVIPAVSGAHTPLPEQCVTPPKAIDATGIALYCAIPLSTQGSNFIDAWHQGAASTPNALARFDLSSNVVSTLAIPGTAQGGENTNMVGIAVSPHGNYATFINKNNGKLWGVLLQ